MRSIEMGSTKDDSGNCMVLRSGYEKRFVEETEQTTDLSRRATSSRLSGKLSSRYISGVTHLFDQHELDRRYDGRLSQFTPDLTSTPLRFASETNFLSRESCSAAFGSILNTGESARSSVTNKRVHFELNGSSCKTEQNDVASVRSYSLQGEVKRNGTSWNGYIGSQQLSSEQLLTPFTKLRPEASKKQDMFSSDEEDVTADTTGVSSESNASCRPVYIIRDAASFARLSSREHAAGTRRDTGSGRTSSEHARSWQVAPSTSNSITTVVSAVSFFVWGTVYKFICSVLLFDAWLLSRFTEKQRRRLGLLLLLFLLPVVFWPCISQKESSLSPIASAASGAATSFWDSIGKASSTLGSSLIGISSLFRAPSLSLPSWHSTDDVAPKMAAHTEEATLPQGQLGDEELRNVVRAIVAEQLRKWESGKNFVSRDQVEQMSAQVEDTLKGKLDSAEERNRDVAADVDQLKTKVEELGTANAELRLVGDTLKKCCRDNKEVLYNLDAKIAAAVLEVLNQPSALTSETAFHQWILGELSTRDSRLSVALDDLRHQVAAAAAKSQQADIASQEASRLASETKVAVANVRSQVGSLTGTRDCPEGGGVGNIDVKSVVREALMLYDADKTAMPDYALESAGGSVVNTRCTETYGRGTAHYQVFGIPVWTMTRTPREAIQPGVSPGECWAFRGSQGNLVLQLAMTIRPTGFTVEHIPRSLAIGGNLDSAPREFTILGLRRRQRPVCSVTL
ncbi:SUN domain-containing protein 1-like isoform X2 [Ornithodoros turicata]|uniref:SUN domain-containing protein 1-like isoform X2 n=1 Tax=Ornithodoros turicata TaxID=34597 RepID=UPI0031395867